MRLTLGFYRSFNRGVSIQLWPMTKSHSLGKCKSFSERGILRIERQRCETTLDVRKTIQNQGESEAMDVEAMINREMGIELPSTVPKQLLAGALSDCLGAGVLASRPSGVLGDEKILSNQIMFQA